MSLSIAIGNALTGLRSVETGLDTVSRNISSAGVEGYARRTVAAVETGPSGVRDGEVQRVLDAVLQRQIRRESAGAAYTATMAGFLSRLDTSFGVPGGATSLDTLFNGFSGTMQALAAEPASTSARNDALMAGRLLASGFNQLSADIQTLRGDAEAGLDGAVGQVNQALSAIDRIESQLPMVSAGNARADLLDERDRHVDALAQLLDIRVTDRGNGGIAIFTAGGSALFDGQASLLRFEPRATIGPSSLYSPDPDESGVGRLTIVDPQGAAVDLRAGPLQSGEIAALLTLRDETLVDAQARLDAMAAGVARMMSDKPVASTAATSGAATGFDLDMTGLSAGDPITVTVREGAAERTMTFVRVESAAALPLSGVGTAASRSLIGVDFSAGDASVAAQIQTALGGGFAVTAPAAGTLRVLDDGATGATDVVSLSAFATQIAPLSGNAALPLFVDAGNGVASRAFTGAFDGTPQQTGFAGRIAVNPTVLADPGLLVSMNGSTLAGDPTRPQELMNRLTEGTARFLTVGGSVSGVTTASLPGLLRGMLDVQGAQAADAASMDEGQQIVVGSLRQRFSDVSGVSIDTEMARLVELQNAYAANARIISVVQQMLDALMRI